MTRVLLLGALALVSCATTRADSVGGGDARIDADGPEVRRAAVDGAVRCGPDAKGDVVLLDARTGGPLTCALVTVTMDPTGETLFQGRTNARGQFASPRAFSNARLNAVSEGYATGSITGATLQGGRLLELEMPPDDGFWLKVLDTDGNYLQDVLVSFKQGDEMLAQLRTNVLANVFFAQRNPFSGEPVRVETPGYQSMLIASSEQLGDDGHTLTLKK